MKDCSGVMLMRTEEHGRNQPFFPPTVSVDNSLLVEANREQPRNCLAKEKCCCRFPPAPQSTAQKRGFKAEMESLDNQHRNSPFPKVSWYIVESALNKKQSSRQGNKNSLPSGGNSSFLPKFSFLQAKCTQSI